MTTLPADLEALMPEPDIRVDAFGEIMTTDRRTFVMGDFYTADQMREAILDATERAAKLCELEVVEELTEGDLAYNMATRHCAAAIRARTGGGQT